MSLDVDVDADLKDSPMMVLVYGDTIRSKPYSMIGFKFWTEKKIPILTIPATAFFSSFLHSLLVSITYHPFVFVDILPKSQITHDTISVQFSSIATATELLEYTTLLRTYS